MMEKSVLMTFTQLWLKQVIDFDFIILFVFKFLFEDLTKI